VKGTQKLANHFKVKGAPLVVITDPDGAELARAPIAAGESALLAAWDAALKKYADQPIRWESEVRSEAASKRLLVVGFDDEKGEALKALEDRQIVKLHGKCQFVKLAYEKDGAEAKKWGVTQAPTVILCDASKENPEKSPIEKLAGRKSAPALKAALQKAILKVESRK